MNVIDQFRLDGKTALVTGCRAGIGKAMAIGLAEAGANISSVSRTQEDKDSNIAKAIAPLKRDFKGYRCDFGNRDSLYEFIARIKVDFPLVKSAALLGIVFVH